MDRLAPVPTRSLSERMTPTRVLALPALVAWFAVLALMLRTTTTNSGKGDARPSAPDPSDELELLRYENAVLRAEQQRALGIGAVGERIREQLDSVVISAADEGDDNWGALVEATVLREMLLSVCQDLQTAIRNVQVQLASGIPMPEIDRRQSDPTKNDVLVNPAMILPPACDETKGVQIDKPNRSRLGQEAGR